MSRLAPALAVVCLALAACASPASSVLPSGPHTASTRTAPFGGSLHIEPFQIVFSRDKGPAQTVRVWQHGFFGRYTASNLCTGIDVSLKQYVEHVGSIWEVQVKHHRGGPENCAIVFSGTGGHRGKNSLYVSILR
jgi:hypothetical protein